MFPVMRLSSLWPFSVKAREVDEEDSPAIDGSPAVRLPDRKQLPRRRNEEELHDECNIQPHTDDGGDAYYIGDAYEEPKCAHEWCIDTSERPYLAFVKRVSKARPYLRYLASWMEVTAAPPKWKFIRESPSNRSKRAEACKACVLDFAEALLPSTAVFDSTKTLEGALASSPQSVESAQVRLIIVEDLSRDMVELLGARYDIDPLFFLSHIGDYLFHNTRDPWVELPDLDFMTRQQSHFNLQYLRARYFKTKASFDKAEKESGAFNVLRRLDSDRSRKRLQDTLLDVKGASVALTRAKTSLWVKPRKDGDKSVLAILLVDPTVKEGHPLWGGYRPFDHAPSMHAQEPLERPPGTSLFDDAVYWSSKISQQDLALVRTDPRCIAIPMLRLILADWRTVLKYMTTMLGKIEWEFERPHWGIEPGDIDDSLRKLSPWRRNMPYYQGMIADAVNRIFPMGLRAKVSANGLRTLTPDPGPYVTDAVIQATMASPSAGMRSLLPDFRIVQHLMSESQQRIETIQTMATNSINIEESRRAVRQNKNLARLTFLATFFIPLSFTSSFLSMSPDFAAATGTIWLFFVIGLPLTAFALIAVDVSHPQGGYLVRWWRNWTAGEKTTPVAEPVSSSSVPIGKTMPWPTRSYTSYTSIRRQWQPKQQ